MKHVIVTSAAALALLGSLCSFVSSPDATGGVDSATRSTAFDDDRDPTTITGVFRQYGMVDGYIYFSLNGIPIRMLEANFPNPIPANGTVLTATGCTEDRDGGYTCTDLR